MAYMWRGIDGVIYSWVLVAVSFIFVVIRLYVDLKGIRKVAWYRDVITFCAWGFFMAYVVIYSISNDYNWNNWDKSYFMAQTREQMMYAAKLNYISNYMYLPAIYLVKIELLFLYHVLAPRAYHPKIFWSIIFAWSQTICGILAHLGWWLFACPRISDNWTTIPVQTCQASFGQMTTIWIFNIWTDLIIYIIPMFIIYRMQKMSMKDKLSSAAMFFVGFLNIMGAVFCLVGYLMLDVPEFSAHLSLEVMWRWVGVGHFMNAAQMATAVWIVCMPQTKTLWRLIRKSKTSPTSGPVDVENRPYSDDSSKMSPTGSPDQIKAVREKSSFFKSIRITSSAKSQSSGSLPGSPEGSPSGSGKAE